MLHSTLFCKIIYAWYYFISFRVQWMCLWKPPPLVMQDWLVSLCTEVCFCSFLLKVLKTKSHYLLAVRCAFSSWLWPDPIPTGRWKESASAPMRPKAKATDDQMCHSFVFVSVLTFYLRFNKQLWMRPGTKSVKTTLECHVHCGERYYG